MANLTLPPLPYAYNALEPWIDEQTMHVHHDKHHQTYLDNFLKAVTGTALEGKAPTEILANLAQVPENIRTAVRNHGGGFTNHVLYWEIMGPNAGGAPTGDLATAITGAFGTFDTFKEKFSAAAMGQFGSGWAWLVVKKDGALGVYNLPNQDSPLSQGDTPILTLDVWEHAYYLKYQNNRGTYVDTFMDHVVNFEAAEQRLISALKMR
jgi:Fe-Mn family superoxide dismutase